MRGAARNLIHSKIKECSTLVYRLTLTAWFGGDTYSDRRRLNDGHFNIKEVFKLILKKHG